MFPPEEGERKRKVKLIQVSWKIEKRAQKSNQTNKSKHRKKKSDMERHLCRSKSCWENKDNCPGSKTDTS